MLGDGLVLGVLRLLRRRLRWLFRLLFVGLGRPVDRFVAPRLGLPLRVGERRLGRLGVLLGGDLVHRRRVVLVEVEGLVVRVRRDAVRGRRGAHGVGRSGLGARRRRRRGAHGVGRGGLVGVVRRVCRRRGRRGGGCAAEQDRVGVDARAAALAPGRGRDDVDVEFLEVVDRGAFFVDRVVGVVDVLEDGRDGAALRALEAVAEVLLHSVPRDEHGPPAVLAVHGLELRLLLGRLHDVPQRRRRHHRRLGLGAVGRHRLLGLLGHLELPVPEHEHEPEHPDVPELHAPHHRHDALLDRAQRAQNDARPEQHRRRRRRASPPWPCCRRREMTRRSRRDPGRPQRAPVFFVVAGRRGQRRRPPGGAHHRDTAAVSDALRAPDPDDARRRSERQRAHDHVAREQHTRRSTTPEPHHHGGRGVEPSLTLCTA
mmetsp:Transcript_18013/g.72200  ORF Transcript_18013/g.72200 Transcript_18013/m.72200 type:complete len:428 (+) Transcript_18013:529-1812(+)